MCGDFAVRTKLPHPSEKKAGPSKTCGSVSFDMSKLTEPSGLATELEVRRLFSYLGAAASHVLRAFLAAVFASDLSLPFFVFASLIAAL